MDCDFDIGHALFQQDAERLDPRAGLETRDEIIECVRIVFICRELENLGLYEVVVAVLEHDTCAIDTAPPVLGFDCSKRRPKPRGVAWRYVAVHAEIVLSALLYLGKGQSGGGRCRRCPCGVEP